MKKIRLLLILSSIISNSLFAQSWNYNKAFRINSYTYGHQENLQTAILTSGNVVFCWDSWEHLGSIRGIYAQLYDQYGERLGNEIHVNTYEEDNQVFPQIAELPDGGFVICWQSFEQDSSSWGVFAQLFDESGNKIGTEFQVNTYSMDAQFYPKVKAFSDGKFIVTWESENQDGSRGGVFSQIFTKNGEKSGSEFQVNTTSSNDQFLPDILILPSNEFIIYWTTYNQDGFEAGISARLFFTNGTPKGEEFRINTSTNGDERVPNACLLNSGVILFTWRGGNLKPDLYFKIIDAEGNIVKEESLINTLTDLWSWSPDAAALPSGGFVVCWRYFNINNGDIQSIKAQRFDDNGSKLGGEIFVNDNAPNVIAGDPKILALPGGNFIICWNSDERINARFFNNDGGMISEEFIVNKEFSYQSPDYDAAFSLKDIPGKGLVTLWSGPDESNVGLYGKFLLSEPVMHTLTNFSLKQPQDDTIINTPINFVWDLPSNIRVCYPWEIKYDLYISTDESFSNALINTGLTDTLYSYDSLEAAGTYYWKVLAKNIRGDSLWSSSSSKFIYDPTASDVEDDESTPAEFQLFQNYPNPFNPQTTITFTIPQNGFVTLKVFDVLGNEVELLINEFKPAATYNIEFDGSTLSSGVYFYKLQVNDFITSKKMLFIK